MMRMINIITNVFIIWMMLFILVICRTIIILIMKKIIFTSHKGGVGKTTSALVVSQGLTKLGKKVLCIDLDPQSNMSSTLIGRGNRKTIADMLLGEAEPVPQKSKMGIDLLPSGDTMDTKEKILGMEMQYETLLKRLLSKMDTSKYDYCVIDCPPSRGVFTVLGLMVADVYFIPLDPDPYAVDGLVNMVKFSDKVRQFNNALKFGGIFITSTNQNVRTKLTQALIEQVKEVYPEDYLDIFIRESISIPESQLKGESIYDYDPDSNAAQDYMELTKIILEKYK